MRGLGSGAVLSGHGKKGLIVGTVAASFGMVLSMSEVESYEIAVVARVKSTNFISVSVAVLCNVFNVSIVTTKLATKNRVRKLSISTI